MKASDIEYLEKSIGHDLPSIYKDTMLNYPFPIDSFAEEFLLPNDTKLVVELNEIDLIIKGIEQPFFIGSDGSEEYYYIDLKNSESPIYTFELETGNHLVKAKDWNEYMNQIKNELNEIKEDEERERLRSENKQWWEFWK